MSRGLGFGAGTETAPGVYTREIDLTTSTAAGASSEGAIAGLFAWGPVDSPQKIGSEDELALKFGKPSNWNAETWFSASQFLAYGTQLWVNRAADTNNTVFSAIANTAAVTSRGTHTIKNSDDFETKSTSFEPGVNWIARYPGALGNSLKVSVCAGPDQYQSVVNVQSLGSNTMFASSNTKIAYAVGANFATVTVANTAALTANTPMPYIQAIANTITVGDLFVAGNNSIGSQSLKVRAIGGINIANTAGSNTGVASFQVFFDQPLKISSDFSAPSFTRKWEYSGVVGSPSTTWSQMTNESANTAAVDGITIVVADADGKISGRAGAVLEIYDNVSRATDSTTIEAENNFYVTVVNTQSKYIWAASAPGALPSAPMATISSVGTAVPYSVKLAYGTDGPDEANVAIGTILQGYDKFAHKDEYSLAAVITGKTRGGTYGEQLFNYLIDNIAETRLDTVAYGTPSKEAVVNNMDPLLASKNFVGAVRNTSYGFLDSSYKYMYDKYNDVFRYVPLNGDTAGLSCRTDVTNDPWFSPAGYNRGQYKNIIKLSYNPSPSHQKELFSVDINPAVSSADGTYLMGDKTLIGQQSALNQLGTRKMLNVLKTAISKSAKALLYEFNDEFTQARFKSQNEPYLRDIKGRRGLKNFAVICDDSNNTEQVVNSFQFVGDIYLQPNRSIRTIQLNFVAVGGVADFTEIVS